MQIEIIQVVRKGVLETPVLFTSRTKAQAYFNNIAEHFLGEDIEEVNLGSDNDIQEVNRLMEYTGNELHWFVELKIEK